MKATPNNSASIGLSSPLIRVLNPAVCDSGTIAAFMMPIPVNSIPKPMMISPICLTRLFLIKRYMIAPTNSMSGAKVVILNAVICAVTVVPILAPMITPTACIRLMSPAFTKPITITSVADEL